jgi:hypothetical protein
MESDDNLQLKENQQSTNNTTKKLQAISKIPCHSPEGHRDGVRKRLLRPKSLEIR